MTRERDRSASAPREPPHRGPVRHFPTLVTRHPSSFLGPVRAGPAPAAGVVRETRPFRRPRREPGPGRVTRSLRSLRSTSLHSSTRPTRGRSLRSLVPFGLSFSSFTLPRFTTPLREPSPIPPTPLVTRPPRSSAPHGDRARPSPSHLPTPLPTADSCRPPPYPAPSGPKR